MLFLPRHDDRRKFITLSTRVCAQNVGHDAFVYYSCDLVNVSIER